MGELNKLFKARQHLYQGADLEVGTELLKPEQVTEEIAAKFRF